MTKTATHTKGVVPQGEATPEVLSLKQLRFVDEYLVDLNATQAAIRAGYSAKTAKQQGHRLLTYVDVQKAIEAKRKEVAGEIGITRERVLKEMASLAFSDLRGIFDEHGALRPIHTLTAGQAASISSIEVEGPSKQNPNWVTKVKLWPKGPQLENLLKHLGMAEDKPAEAPTGPQQVPNYDLLAAKLAKHVKPEGAQA